MWRHRVAWTVITQLVIRSLHVLRHISFNKLKFGHGEKSYVMTHFGAILLFFFLVLKLFISTTTCKRQQLNHKWKDTHCFNEACFILLHYWRKYDRGSHLRYIGPFKPTCSCQLQLGSEKSLWEFAPDWFLSWARSAAPAKSYIQAWTLCLFTV